jgi:hypothetical protein
MAVNANVRDWPESSKKVVIPGLVRERSEAASVRNPFRNFRDISSQAE